MRRCCGARPISGPCPLENEVWLDSLYDVQRALGIAKVCATHNVKTRQYGVSIEGDRLFHIRTTQPEEVEDLVVRTTLAAAQTDRAVRHGEPPAPQPAPRPLA